MNIRDLPEHQTNAIAYAAYLEQELRKKAEVYGFSFDDIKMNFFAAKNRAKYPADWLLSVNGAAAIPFYGIFLESPAVCLIIDPADGRIVEANHAAANFYGYSITELSGMKIFSLNVSSEASLREYMLRVGNRTTEMADFKHLLKDNQLRDVTIYSVPFVTHDKLLYFSVIIDVTTQREAERKVQKSRDRLAVIIEGTGAGIWEWDILKKKLIIDKAWKSLVGYEASELSSTDQSWQKFCHPGDIMTIRQVAEEALKKGQGGFCVECRVRRKNGTYFWVKSSAGIVYDKEKQPVRIIGSIVDITRHKAAIETQREKGRVLREFAQVIADKGFILDEDGAYIEVFGDERLLPLPRKEFYGKTLFDLLPEGRAEFFLQEIRRTIDEGKVRRGKIALELFGSQRIFDTRAALIDYKVAGKKVVAVVMTDITDQEQIRARLQASYEMRRRSDIFNDLLNGARCLDEDLTAYVRNLKLNFDRALFCCAIHAKCKEGKDTSEDLQGVKDAIVNTIHGIEGCTSFNCRGQIGIVCQAHYYSGGRQISRRKLAEEIYALVVREYQDVAVYIGIGEIQRGLKGFCKSFQQAWDAAAACCQGLTFDKNIIYFRELGVFQLLFNKEGKERAADFTRLTIQKLIEYDSEKGTDYLDTLDVILHSANLKEAAETLFLHHNTVIFRKKRIEAILGCSLNDFETSLSLALAIKFYRMSANKVNVFV